MALVPIKTSVGTGYCDCICGCYELSAMRDEESGKGFCPRCAEEHMDRNRAIIEKLPKAEAAGEYPSLPPGAKPPALQNRA